MRHVIEFTRRLNDADARFFYLGERSDCNVAMLMVSVLATEVSLDALVEEFVPDEGGVPRFADYLRRAPLDLAPPVWMPLPEEERVVARYGREMTLPPGADWDDVMAIVDEVQSARFERGYAPWNVAVIKGAPDGRTVLVLKVHHVLSDGMAFAMLFAKTFAPDALAAAGAAIEVVTEPPPRAPRLWLALTHVGASLGRWTRLVIASLPALARDPERRRRERRAVRALLRAPRRFPPSAFGSSRKLLGYRLPASAWRSAAEVRGGASNELFLALVARIVRRAFPDLDLDADPLRIGMPISLRGGFDQAGGNSAAVGIVELTGGTEELEQLGTVRARAAAAKREVATASEPTLFEATLDLLPGRLRGAIEFRRGVAFDVLATNVPIPTGGNLLGVPVEQVLMVAPSIGQLASFSLTEYDGDFYLAANSDRSVVPESIEGCADAVIEELFGRRHERFGVVPLPAGPAKAAVGEGGAFRWDSALKNKSKPEC